MFVASIISIILLLSAFTSTLNFIESLKTNFKKTKSVRISVLKSARENGKADVKKYAEEIVEKLGTNYKARVIGFVIVLRKVGK